MNRIELLDREYLLDDDDYFQVTSAMRRKETCVIVVFDRMIYNYFSIHILEGDIERIEKVF